MAETVKRKRCGREELKRQVLESASQAFMKSGIRNVHMDDIALSLSISKRTLYELFRDKERLLLEVVRMRQEQTKKYMMEIATKSDNVLEVLFTFYERRVTELCQMNPAFFRDLRKYPNVLGFIHEEQKVTDKEACDYFQRGVEQGIFRSDINFKIINEAISLQFDMLIYSDITENYPLEEIYSEITFLNIRGITTLKGYEIVDSFLKRMKEHRKQG